MRNAKITELELRKFFVEQQSSAEVILHVEVPVFCRSVDLVAQNKKDKSLAAIEFKLHDWKRAILQVQSVALCFDYLYICLPMPKTAQGRESILNQCSQNGVGVYFYAFEGECFEMALESPQTSTVWAAQKKQIVSYLEAIANE